MLIWVQSQGFPDQLIVVRVDQLNMVQKPFHTICCSISVQFSAALQALCGITLPSHSHEGKAELQLVGRVSYMHFGWVLSVPSG